MAHILTTDPEQARGARKPLSRVTKHRHGGVALGIFKIMFRDLNVAFPGGRIYNLLHVCRWSSPLTRPEMVHQDFGSVVEDAFAPLPGNGRELSLLLASQEVRAALARKSTRP
jgi:hypothetical protein